VNGTHYFHPRIVKIIKENKRLDIFDVHVAVHRDKFFITKPTRCTNFSKVFILEWNSTCFGQFLCPSSGVFHCTHSNGIYHTGLLTACEQDQDETAMVVVGPVRPDHDQQHCYHHAPTVKTRGCYWGCWAPDDGHEDARDMLSCTYMCYNVYFCNIILFRSQKGHQKQNTRIVIKCPQCEQLFAFVVLYNLILT